MRATKYTREGLIALAAKFSSRAELRAHDGNRSYGMMKHLRIIEECTAHMPDRRCARKRSTNELVESASRFATLKEWRINCKTDYKLAKYRGILAECTVHMPRKSSYKIYAYEFPGNSVYIGLTSNSAKLDPLAVQKYADDQGCLPSVKILEPEGNLTDLYAAGDAKREWLIRYKQLGWTVINQPARSTGLPRSTDAQAVVDSARQFKTRAEWVYNRPREYRQARHMGLLDKIYAFLDRGSNRVSIYSDEDLLTDALKYKTKKEWHLAGREDKKQGRPSRYSAALCGILRLLRPGPRLA